VNAPLAYRTELAPQVTHAMSALVQPKSSYVSCAEVIQVLLGAPNAHITELASLPLREVGQRLVALRYLVANRTTWQRHFNWERAAARVRPEGPLQFQALAARIEALSQHALSAAGRARLDVLPAHDVGALIALAEQLSRCAVELGSEAREQSNEASAGSSAADEGLSLLIALTQESPLRALLRTRLREAAEALCESAPRAADVLYLCAYELTDLPATTCGAGDLAYLIVADKGEMGVRAVREAIALGIVPVVLYSQQDDQGALQVRLAHKSGGFAIPLRGSFRESYANYVQIAQAVLASYETRFAGKAAEMLARSALYPGYGPLAENTAAIEHFRRSGIAFVGPMQDVVERAGDKRRFRSLAEAIEPKAVVPGIVLDEQAADAIVTRIAQGHAEGRFTFPGRLKAANGGGGRGQAVVQAPEGVRAAVERVLSEIAANGWDHGVMFEQNIAETVHLEVQVVRDRFGNARHFGMRDCTEQRASQKIQEEAPPALLRDNAALTQQICQIALGIADAVGYVGACTVELMYKDGHFYLLEMNTRIQVEHPVSEAAHRVRTKDGQLAELNLVQLQLLVARGRPIPFAQEAVVCTHVAREFRINAESWRPDVKDSRDGKLGLFLPNAGVFSTIEVPDGERVRSALVAQGVSGIADLTVRFDCGFEPGDKLVNKDPTFGKLIVALRPEPAHEGDRYELLRKAAIEVLSRLRIEGRQVLPTGHVIPKSVFATNLLDHVRILQTQLMTEHARANARGRHVNWVVDALRKS
jgi:acetyl/propionyl-CoA carboxylase alpha subunit